MVDWTHYTEAELNEIKDYNSWPKLITTLTTLGIGVIAILWSLSRLI